MASIFISHASKDSDSAVRIRTWLSQLGYEDIFLDLDKIDGIQPGADWQQRLAQAMRRADVVLCLLSESWFSSVWCSAEHTLAVLSQNAIIPIWIASGAEGALADRYARTFGSAQFLSLFQHWDDGLLKLERTLDRSRITPLAFAYGDTGS